MNNKALELHYAHMRDERISGQPARTKNSRANHETPITTMQTHSCGSRHIAMSKTGGVDKFDFVERDN